MKTSAARNHNSFSRQTAVRGVASLLTRGQEYNGTAIQGAVGPYNLAVIPTREQLKAIANAPSGDLSTFPFPIVLFALAVQRSTVVLLIKRGQLEKSIVFEAGVPVDCRSNLAHETLGRFLVSSGKISDDQFNSALTSAASRAMPLGEVLVERGQITPFELFRLLQQNLAQKLLDAFAWRDGEYHILRDVPPVESPLKVKVPQLVFTGLLKFAPQEDIDAGVVPLVGKKLAVHPEPPFPLEELRFSAAQSSVVEALGTGKRIDELAEATQLPFEEISRILYALAVIGVAVPSDRLPKVAPPPKPAPPPPPVVEARPQAPAAPAADIDKIRNDLMQAYLSFRKQDAFDLLHVPEDVTPPAIDAAWLAYAKRFAPWVFVDSLASLADKAQELFLAGAKAYGQLTESEHRNSLIARRRNLRDERQRKVDAGIFRIKTDLLDSETQYRKARALMDASKYREAITLLEFASDCDPQNALYRADLAWCRFLLNPNAAAKPSIAELKEAVRIDPECGIAWYYAGEILARSGDRDEAEKHYRRAIKLMAPDRRPIDALKALNVKA